MVPFNGLAVDAERLGVGRDLFRLFAPTEADICIGDAGGGMTLPMIMGRPSLTLNFHPIGCATPSTWVYPKHIVDRSGAPVPYQRVIKEDPFGYVNPEGRKHDDWIALTNTSDEILEAIQCFLEDLSGAGAKIPGEDFNGSIPQLSMFYQYGSRVSPAFIRRDSMISSKKKHAVNFVDTHSL